MPALLALAPTEAVPETVAVRDRASTPITAAAATTAFTVPAMESGSGKPLVIEQAEDGLFYVEARVNGAPVQFVVDTGSSVVILNGPDAARAGVGADDSVDVETAGGSAQMARARIANVVFAGKTMTGVDAAIVKRDLKVSLLGQSVLTQLASVSFKGRHLEMH